MIRAAFHFFAYNCELRHYKAVAAVTTSMCSERPYTLILMDLRMPNMVGRCRLTP